MDFNLKTVEKTGNGMYVWYPTVTDSTDKKVENELGRRSYYNMPKQVTWDSIKTFHFTFGVPIEREMQYNEGIHVRLERRLHGIFLQRMPVFSIDSKDSQSTSLMRDTYQVGVRMSRDPETGLKDAIPEPGDIVMIDIYNGDKARGREHEVVKENICFGRVGNLGGKAWLEKTGTDFCVLMTIPKKSKLQLKSYHDAKNLENRKLYPAKLKVKVSRTSAIQEQIAFEKFCRPDFSPELLDEIRLAFWSVPNAAPKLTDLTVGLAHSRSDANKERYRQFLEEFGKSRKHNHTQDIALNAASYMRSRITVVQGPPGAEKTRTLRDKVIALTKIGHKVACVASSSVAVATHANAV